MNNNQNQVKTVTTNKDSSLTDNWITVKDINNNLIFIMDQNSQAIMMDALKTFYNQVDFEFWLIVADRPVDISVYVSQLEVHLGTVQNPAIRKLIVSDIEKADLFVQNDVVDTEYFILFKDKNTEIINKRIRTIINNLASCGLIASQTSNEDLRMILDNFLNGGKTYTNRTVTVE